MHLSEVIMKDQLGVSSSCSKCTDMHETSKEPQTFSESESVTDKEDDVKVCDICGDAGQEDLLAVCSRCIDGAEHTYCMQIMLDKLPVGDWLCEDCKFKNFENQKAQKFYTVTKTQKESDAQNAGSPIYSEIRLNKDGLVINLEDMAASRSPQIPVVYNENIDLNIRICEKASITSQFPTEASVSQEVILLSPEDSSMNPNSLTIKASNPEQSNESRSIFEGQKAHTSSGFISSSGVDGFKVVSGPLLKTSSFKNTNAKPKVKQLLGVVPLAKNATGKFTSKAPRKGGLTREISKSASFKTEKGVCNSYELENEKPSVNIVQIEDLSGERDKELSVIERANSSKVAFFQVADARISRGSVDGDISGHNRENLLHSSKSSTNASTIGLNLDLKNRCQVPDDFHSNVNVTNKSCKPGYDPVSQHDNHLCLESLHQNDITKVVTSSATLNKPLSSSGRTIYCQKCNEAGHPTHLCSIDNHCISAFKLSVDRVSRENAILNNKWKAARETIISKQEALKCTDNTDQSKELYVSSPKVVNKEVPPHYIRKTYFQEGRTNCTSSFVFDKSKSAIHPHEIHHKVGAGKLNPSGNISKQFEMKPSEQIFPSLDPCFSNIQRPSVIPKLEYFWQGGFEVLKTGKLPECCDGLQAHFSSYASGKVFEAAKKFPPNKVQLEEVPCLSSWPWHFGGSHAKEHHIALFFFAKDIESYRSDYCKLLDNMLKYDLALKGNFDGFELLIFPSYKLSGNSQRWNRLLFLWGIFKRRPSSLKMLSNVQEDPCNSTMDVSYLIENLPTTLPEASRFQETKTSGKSYEADDYATHMEVTPASCRN